MAKKQKPRSNPRGKTPPTEEQASPVDAKEEGATTGETAANETGGGEPEKKPTLEELTEIEKTRLEKELANKFDLLDDAMKELKSAKQVLKDCKKEAEEYRASVLQTNRALREIIRGNWRPPKPDPQRKFDYPEDLPQDPGNGTGDSASDPAPEPEADSFWKSKPVTELGLSKTLVKKLENEGYTTLGVIVAELEEGQKFESLEFTDRQISSIRSAVHKHRPPDPSPTPPESTEQASDESHEQEADQK